MLQTTASPSPQRVVKTASGTVEVYGCCNEVDAELWERSFGSQAIDGRYYQIAEECLGDQFEFVYMVLRDGQSGAAAVQPAIVVDQDGAAGLPAGARRLAEGIRKLFPGFLRMRLLMVGCAAGEGHLGSAERWALETLHAALPDVARSVGAPIIVLKDIPSNYRETVGAVFERDYRRVPGMPGATLDLDYASFEDYLQRRVGGCSGRICGGSSRNCRRSRRSRWK